LQIKHQVEPFPAKEILKLMGIVHAGPETLVERTAIEWENPVEVRVTVQQILEATVDDPTDFGLGFEFA
jgi:hypothetical protein